MTNVCPPKPTTFFLPNFSEKKKVHLHSPHNIMSCEMRTVNYHLHESKYGLRFQMGEYYSLAQDCSLSLNVCIIPPLPLQQQRWRCGQFCWISWLLQIAQIFTNFTTVACFTQDICLFIFRLKSWRWDRPRLDRGQSWQKYKFATFQSCHSQLKVPLLPSVKYWQL